MRFKKQFIQTIYLIVGLGLAQLSYADPATYKFNGVVTQGNLVGEVLVGQFTVDDGPGLALTSYKAAGNVSDGVLLAFSSSIDGNMFVMTDEIGFSFRPVVVFYGGIVNAMVGFFDTTCASLDIYYDTYTGADGFVYRRLPNGELNFGVIEGFELMLDGDSDEVLDAEDNCPLVPNAGQRDMDGDRIGDACDADLDNDGDVGYADVALWSELVRHTDEGEADHNRDGSVNFIDFVLLSEDLISPILPCGIIAEVAVSY